MLGSLPPATRAIILICVAVFLLQQVPGGSPPGEPDWLMIPLALWPLGPLFKPWQVVTYAFLHGGWAHLFFNMFALFMFGGLLERYWGSTRFTAYYLVCVVAAAVTQLAVQYGTDGLYPTLGASGGVFGLLLAFAIYFPQQRLIVLPIPIPVPAWLFVTIYGAIELFLGVTGAQSTVAHFAHLGGMLGGAVMLLSWHRDKPQS